jgi:hypothetical protein
MEERDQDHGRGLKMAGWTRDELESIAAAEELELMPVGRDGRPRKPVTIWVVRHLDDLYVRSWRGRDGAWFRAVQLTHEGRIRAGGVESDVVLVEAKDDDVNDAVDDAYRDKYHRYADTYVGPMVRPEARETTMKLVPRPEGGT